jgi:hypothetical protein
MIIKKQVSNLLTPFSPAACSTENKEIAPAIILSGVPDFF